MQILVEARGNVLFTVGGDCHRVVKLRRDEPFGGAIVEIVALSVCTSDGFR